MFGGINTYGYVIGNPHSYVDAYGLVPGAGPLKPPTIKNPAAIGVFGCVGLSCLYCSTGDDEPQLALELSLGGGIELCDSLPAPRLPPASREKTGSCGFYDKRCDDIMQPPGFPIPKRFGGFMIGAGFKRDGRFCVRIGPHVSVPFVPSLDVGGISE